MSIGNKIRKVRKKRGISQGDLAEMIKVTPAHLSRIEHGKYQPSVEVLRKLSVALQVSADYLLSEEEEGEIKDISIQDESLADRIRLLNLLEGKDKEAIFHIIDSILTKKKILKLLTEGELAKAK